jgi:CheY-like chemotaxis protein
LILSDVGKIHQLLFILLYNAFKNTQKGFVKVSFEPVLDDDEHKLRLTIADSGSGINLASQKNLFKMFNHLQKKGKINTHGVGLGLTKCREIISKLGGTIVCSSKVDLGTSFIIDLCDLSDHTEYDKENDFSCLYGLEDENITSFSKYSMLNYANNTNSSIFLGITAPIKLPSVLVVDDDAFNNFAMEQLIQSIGKYNVHLAMNGREAVDAVVEISLTDKKFFDVIIMDLNMPVMNGLDATKELRNLHEDFVINLSKTKIYMHSAIQESIDWEPLFDAKCKYFLFLLWW